MKKVKSIALALGLGISLSSVFAGTAISAPGEYDCQQLQIKCAAGDSFACSVYNTLCRYTR